MKYLKYAIVILTVLFIAFLAVGMIKTEVSYSSDVMVEKSTNEAWAVLQDPEKLGEWLPGFQKMEHISGVPGTVGAVSEVYFDENGEAMSIKETITAVVPGETMSMLYESDFMDMDYQIKLTAIEGNTKIETFTTNKGNGLFSRSILALMGGSLKQQEEMNLSSLKKAIEENTKEYSQIDY